jgi:translocation and assembly module TamB
VNGQVSDTSTVPHQRNFGPLSKPSSDTDAAQPKKARRNKRRVLLRVLFGLLLLPFLLVAIAVILLYLPPIQNVVRGKAVDFLTDKIGTVVTLESLHLRFPLGVKLEGLYVEDQRGDTLLYAGDVRTRVGLRALFGKRILLDPIELSDVRATLYQDSDSVFNFDFIIDAFVGPDTAVVEVQKDGTGGFNFAIGAVRLKRIHYDMLMEPSELALDLHLGELELDFDLFALDPMAYHVDELVLKNTRIAMRSASGEPAPPTYPDLENPLADIDVRFNGISLEEVSFSMMTTDTGDSLWIAVNEAELNTRSIDLTKQQLALEELDLDGLKIGMLAMSRETVVDTVTSADPAWLDRDDGFRFWTQDWDLTIDELRMANSGFAMHADSIIGPALLFDPAHIAFTNMALDATDVAVSNSRIALGLNSLVAHGGRDSTAVELAFQAEATPGAFILHDGSAKALGNAVTFRLEARPGDLSTVHRTPYEVPIEVEVGSALRMAELLPLLHELGVELPAAVNTDERWDTRLWLTGTPRRADRMGISLVGDQGSRISLEGTTRAADRWPYNTFELRLDELTMGRGMRQVMRAYTPPDIVLPQRLTMRGNASGQGGMVRTVLALDSDLGRITGFGVVNDWNGRIPDGLDLALTASALDVGRFIGDTAMAPMSFKIIAGGERLNSPTRIGSFALTPEVLSYGGNDLSSLFLNVSVDGDSLDVALGSRAEAVDVILDASGRWPEAGDSLAFNVDLIVRKLQLKDIGVTEHVLDTYGRIAGRVAVSPEGFGRVGLRGEGLRLANAEREFRFERFKLHALFDTDSTAVELDSDAITLDYHTNLGIDSLLPRSTAKFQSFFRPEGSFVPQPGKSMDLALTLPRPDWLTEMVLPDLHALDLRNFSGSYDSDSDVLRFAIDLPHADYGGIDVHGLLVQVDAEQNQLQGSMHLQRVERDSIFVENLSLEATSANDLLHAMLVMRDGEHEVYRVGASLAREDAIPVLRMDKEFMLNYRPWTADSTNALYFAEEGLRAENFALSSNGQRVELRTGRQRNHIAFTDLQLTTLSELVSSTDSVPLVSGRLNGTLSLPFVEEGRLAGELTIAELDAKGVRLGDLAVRFTELQDQRYRAQLGLTDASNRMQAKADADFSQDDAVIHGDAELAFKDLSFLKPFISGYLFSLSGGLNGRLRYVQDGAAVSVIGKATLENAGVGVIQTGAVYRFPNETIVFDEQGLLLENVTVLDSSDNSFRLDGRVLTASGTTPGLDLRLRTQRFQLVNSTIEQNPMFFGDLFGNIDLSIGGTATSPVVGGHVGILDGTRISVVLPGSRVELIEHEGIVLFTDDYDGMDTLALNTDGQMLRDSLAAQLPGVELDLKIKLDKRAVFAVVIDPTTGDEATFSGEADLVFRYSPDGDIHVSGPFTIAQGGYTLEFYGLVKKRFELVPGGTVVWDGDLLQARMNVQARYRSNTAPFPLVANAGGGITESERNRLQARLPFDVLINIRESLSSPDISFGLDLDRMSRNNFPQVNSQLEQLQQPANEEELNRQVFALLVLNTFIQDEGTNAQPGTNLATTAARNSVNSILTDQLNNLTGERIKGMDIQLGVNTYDQTTGGEVYQRTTVDYKVSQRILNDRVNIEAGGSIGVDERNPSVGAISNTNAAQYAITYDLTKDGRLRLRAFHENAFDLFDGEIINNGIAIALTRDFEENSRDREKRRKAIIQQRDAKRPEDE